MITLLTPTGDRPSGVAFMERWIRGQTLWGQQPLQWIVVDDGMVPADLTLGQTHIRRRRQPLETRADSFCRNLMVGLSQVRGDLVVFIEDDDIYQPSHLEQMAALYRAHPEAWTIGDEVSFYYNVATRQWRVIYSPLPALCQTAMPATLIPSFAWIVQQCFHDGRTDVDHRWWRSVPLAHRIIVHSRTVIGIKGLPGRPGIGIGHRPTGPDWKADPHLEKLRSWIGADADLYAAVGTAQSLAERVE